MKDQIAKLWKKYVKKHKLEDQKKLAEYYFNTIVKDISSNLSRKINHKLSKEELASYGVIGLYRAIAAFDPERGNKFETYAFSRIWGSMMDQIRKNDWVPRSVRTKHNLFENTRIKLESKYGCKVSEDLIIKESGIDISKNKNDYSPSFCFSLESAIEPDSDIDGKDFNKYLEDKTLSSVDSKLIRKEFVKKLFGNELSKLERKIIYHYYYEGITLRKIADIINLSVSKTTLMHKSIINKLRDRIQNNTEYFNEEMYEAISSCELPHAKAVGLPNSTAEACLNSRNKI